MSPACEARRALGLARGAPCARVACQGGMPGKRHVPCAMCVARRATPPTRKARQQHGAEGLGVGAARDAEGHLGHAGLLARRGEEEHLQRDLSPLRGGRRRSRWHRRLCRCRSRAAATAAAAAAGRGRREKVKVGAALGLRQHAPVRRRRRLEPAEVVDVGPLVAGRVHAGGGDGAGEGGRQRAGPARGTGREEREHSRCSWRLGERTFGIASVWQQA